MQGVLKNSVAGWYVLSASHKNVIFGEPIMVRHIIKDQNNSKLLELENNKVNFDIENDLAVLIEPEKAELIYCYCGRTLKCDCSRSK